MDQGNQGSCSKQSDNDSKEAETGESLRNAIGVLIDECEPFKEGEQDNVDYCQVESH